MPKSPMFCVLLRAPLDMTVETIEAAIVEGARALGFEVEAVEVSAADESCVM